MLRETHEKIARNEHSEEALRNGIVRKTVLKHSSEKTGSRIYDSNDKEVREYERRFLFKLLLEVGGKKPPRVEFGACYRIWKALRRRGLTANGIKIAIKEAVLLQPWRKGEPLELMKFAARMLLDMLPMLMEDERAKLRTMKKVPEFLKPSFSKLEAKLKEKEKSKPVSCRVCGQPCEKVYEYIPHGGSPSNDRAIISVTANYIGKPLCLECYVSAKKAEARVLVELLI